MQIKDIDWFQTAEPNDPQLPRRIAAALKSIAKQSTITEQQGNLNPAGQPDPPPNIQGLTVTAQNGHFQFAIQDANPNLRRGVSYFIEHSGYPDFRDSHAIKVGDPRNHNEFLGNATRYFRAASAYDSSPPSRWVYFGSPNPIAVTGGGAVGPPAFLPSHGSGTGAPAQGLAGPGPVPVRTAKSGVAWTGQRAGGPPGILGTGLMVTPSGSGLSSGGGGGGGTPVLTESGIAPCEWLMSVVGTNTITAMTAVPYASLAAGFVVRFLPVAVNTGPATLNVNSTGAKTITKNGANMLVGGELQIGHAYLLEYDSAVWQIIGASFPISATVLASDTLGAPSVAPLADTKIWIGQGSGLPVAQAVTGDATLADTGVLTLDTVNADVGTFGDDTHTVTITVNGKGLITAISINGVTITGAQVIAALGYTPAVAGGSALFSLTAPVGGGPVTGTITQV